ncbi:MAG: hypothetical protein R3C68_16345 [Myxococcota bacterium]
MSQRGNLLEALSVLEDALKLNDKLGKRPDVIAAVISGYRDRTTRPLADTLVDTVLQKAAISALSALLKDESLDDRTAQHAIAKRLEKLGAGQEVDWVKLSIADLQSSNCKVRKAAIGRHVAADANAVRAPPEKFADSKECGAAYAAQHGQSDYGQVGIAKLMGYLMRHSHGTVNRTTWTRWTFHGDRNFLSAVSNFRCIRAQDANEVIDLSGLWLFQRTIQGFARPGLDDLAWDERQVPTGGTDWGDRVASHGWYRLHISLGEDAIADHRIVLEDAREAVEVMNGYLVARRGRFGASALGGARELP